MQFSRTFKERANPEVNQGEWDYLDDWSNWSDWDNWDDQVEWDYWDGQENWADWDNWGDRDDESDLYDQDDLAR